MQHLPYPPTQDTTATRDGLTWDAGGSPGETAHSWDAGGSPAIRRSTATSQDTTDTSLSDDPIAGEPPASQVSPSQVTPSRITPRFHCRHYLPHIEYQQLQFVTYRLYDSVPKEVLQQWQQELNQTDPENEAQQYRKLCERIANYEDQGYGQCFLKDPHIANIVQDNLLHFNGKRYDLINWCIMPNHVHVLIEVKQGTLTDILHSWRSYTAHQANSLLARQGPFWMEEYFDRYIRNAQHFKDVMDYIDHNPAKAGLISADSLWPWSAAAHRH